jgi:sugar lactone lactonase YvrE
MKSLPTRLALPVCLWLISTSVTGQTFDPIRTPTNDYSVNKTFFKLPSGRTIGSTASIDVAVDGKIIWVFDRCGADNCVGSNLEPILQFDMSGEFLQSFGAGMFIRPHGTHLDNEGNLWVTDGEGPNGDDPRRDGKGHQVFKFSPQGELLMVLGKAGIAGDGPDVFNQPSDVLVAPNGDIFIGDGHGGRSNSRIVKLTSSGEFIKSWGTRGTGPGQFDTPHALAMDSRGRLFVGDRGNNRVQIFDQEGNFLDEWSGFGRPSGIYIDANDILYVTDSSSSPRNNPGIERGIRIANAGDGKVFAFIIDPDEAGSQEGVVADADGNIYGSSTRGMSLQKYTKRN